MRRDGKPESVPVLWYPEGKLAPFAYSLGYEAHLKAWDELKPQCEQLKDQLGIAEGSFVILYCGRLSDEKSPLDLLEAYRQVTACNKSLCVVGDSELRGTLQNYAAKHVLGSVCFYGFCDRNEIAKYYAVADVLVLPSKRDTWGIVVSEALCYELPVVTSDQVGAALDLVRDGENGYILESGNVAELTSWLQQVIDLTEEERRLMGLTSRRMIAAWIERKIAQSLDEYLDLIYSQ